MDWFLSVITLSGNFLIGRKLKVGWVVFMIASVLWIYYAIFMLNPSQYGLVPAAVINLGIAISSFRKWYKDDRIG